MFRRAQGVSEGVKVPVETGREKAVVLCSSWSLDLPPGQGPPGRVLRYEHRTEQEGERKE